MSFLYDSEYVLIALQETVMCERTHTEQDNNFRPIRTSLNLTDIIALLFIFLELQNVSGVSIRYTASTLKFKNQCDVFRVYYKWLSKAFVTW